MSPRWENSSVVQAVPRQEAVYCPHSDYQPIDDSGWFAVDTIGVEALDRAELEWADQGELCSIGELPPPAPHSETWVVPCQEAGYPSGKAMTLGSTRRRAGATAPAELEWADQGALCSIAAPHHEKGAYQ